ncbi:WD40 repeat domain-containing protein [Microcoleus sp. FACHB-53]|nr:WD40 repeat domain-containing protein [Microcoleus sp. FACHB-53]
MFWKTASLWTVAATVALTAISLSQEAAQLTSTAQVTNTTPALTDSGQQNQPIRIIPGIKGGVSAVAVNPDGQLLATASTGEPSIQLWNPQTGQLLRTLKGHTSPVADVAISPDGKILVTGSGDKTIKLWDVNTGQLIRTLAGHSDVVRTVAISQDGTILASGSWDKTIKLWNLETGALIRTLTGHTQSVSALALSSDGETLASGSVDETLRIWNLKTGKLLQTYSDNFSPYPGYFSYSVNSVAISPDGQFVASSTIDDVSKGHIEGNTIRIRSLKTGQIVHSLKAGSGNSVNTIAFSPDGQTLIASSGDVMLWNLQTGERSRTVSIGSQALALSRDGQTLFSAGNGSLTIWGVPALISDSLQNEQLLRTINAHQNAPQQGWGVYTVALTPDGQTIASCSANNNGEVKVWNRDSGALLYTLKTGILGCAIATSPDGETLATSSVRAGGSQIIKVFNFKTGQLKTTLSGGDSSSIDQLVFSTDGQTLISGGINDGKDAIKVWNLATGQLRHTLSENRYQGFFSLAISPDGKTLFSKQYRDEVRVWDLQAGKLKGTLPIQSFGDIRVSPDGQVLMGTDGKGDINAWSLPTGKLVGTVPLSSLHFSSYSPSRAFAISPSGQILATDNESNSITLWNLQTGKLIDTLRGHPNTVASLAFSADNQILVSGGREGLVKIWRIPTSPGAE